MQQVAPRRPTQQCSDTDLRPTTLNHDAVSAMKPGVNPLCPLIRLRSPHPMKEEARDRWKLPWTGLGNQTWVESVDDALRR